MTLQMGYLSPTLMSTGNFPGLSHKTMTMVAYPANFSICVSIWESSMTPPSPP